MISVVLEDEVCIGDTHVLVDVRVCRLLSLSMAIHFVAISVFFPCLPALLQKTA